MQPSDRPGMPDTLSDSDVRRIRRIFAPRGVSHSEPTSRLPSEPFRSHPKPRAALPIDDSETQPRFPIPKPHPPPQTTTPDSSSPFPNSNVLDSIIWTAGHQQKQNIGNERSHSVSPQQLLIEQIALPVDTTTALDPVSLPKKLPRPQPKDEKVFDASPSRIDQVACPLDKESKLTSRKIACARFIE
jgi:hypothetical protein